MIRLLPSGINTSGDGRSGSPSCGRFPLADDLATALNSAEAGGSNAPMHCVRDENASCPDPKGAGEMPIAPAPGLAACQKGCAVRFTPAFRPIRDTISAVQRENAASRPGPTGPADMAGEEPSSGRRRPMSPFGERLPRNRGNR